MYVQERKEKLFREMLRPTNLKIAKQIKQIEDGETDTFSLGGSNLTTKSIKPLMGFLSKEGNKARKLLIQENALMRNGVLMISSMLEVNRGLVTINLKSSGVGDEGVKMLAGALKTNQTLKHLMLSSNSIGLEGISALTAVLRDSVSRLEMLDLERNDVGDDGAELIANALRTNKTLNVLILEDCSIGTMGAKSIAAALVHSNETLLKLNLGSNWVGAQGCKEFAKVISKKNATLETLSVSSNNIGVEGANALGTALMDNTSLLHLDIYNNQLGSPGLCALVKAMKVNSTFELLRMGKNRLLGRTQWFIKRMISIQDHQFPDNFVGGDNVEKIVFHQPIEDLKKSRSGLRTPISYQDRLDMIIDIVFDLDGVEDVQHCPMDQLKFSEFAHILAQQQTDYFITMMNWLAEEDAFPKSVFRKMDFWLQTKDEPGAAPIVQNICLNSEAQLSLQFCQLFIGDLLTLKDGLELLQYKSSLGLTLKVICLANPRLFEWARKYGTYLDRYVMVDGPAVHESKTCSVHFAENVATNELVAVKIMRNREQYQRELEARRLDLSGVLPVIDHFDDDLALIMPRGSRSLFEAINTERFAGLDLGKIRAIIKSMAIALQEVHAKGQIHGDLKPRNLVRVSQISSRTFTDGGQGNFVVSMQWQGQDDHQIYAGSASSSLEEWNLIDFDASVSIGQPLTEKLSSGYAPPELARREFFPDPQKRPKVVIAKPSIDIWGLGVVLFQLLSGRKLFFMDDVNDELVEERDMAELMNWITINPERLARIEAAGREANWDPDDVHAAQDLVQACLQGNPSDRIELDVLLEKHPFLNPGMINTLQRRNSITARKDFGTSYHFFLSHMQSEAAGTVKDLYRGILRSRCSAWLDMLSDDLTLDGMKRGILASKVFVMVLTKNVLFRPFCIIELHFAIKNGKDIIFIVEDDHRFPRFDIDRDTPWALLENRKMENVDHDYQFKVKNLKDGLKDLKQDKEDVESILQIIRNVLLNGSVLPYRRRAFESDAMLMELLSLCDLSSPELIGKIGATEDKMDGEKVNDRTLCILHNNQDRFAQEIEASISNRPIIHRGNVGIRFDPIVMNRSDFHHQYESFFQDGNGCLLILLGDELFPSSTLENALHDWCCVNRKPFVIIDTGWDWSKKKAHGISNLELSNTFFIQHEIMKMRSIYDSSFYRTKHEHIAMVDEIKRRLFALATLYE